MKRFYTGFLFLLLTFSQFPAVATHIVGGEMNYRYLGNDQYLITLAVYRDCYNGQAPFDDPAYIAAFDQNGNLVLSDTVALYSIQPVPNAINSPCLPPPTNVCYEVGHYYKVLTLPPLAGGYTLAYQRCCRNHSIVNIYNPGSTGATYTAIIPDQFIYQVNSNPVFNQLPPTFICANAPFKFDHSATDFDGDSLSYELCEPYEGGTTITPLPTVPDPPPYIPVTFMFPYDITDVMGGVPMVIDSKTGLLQATPSSVGQYVYGVMVKEYRNGILIGETRRDFQINVTNCPGYTVASVSSPIHACGSLAVQFQNNSYGGATYSWTFGDPNSVTDTSTLKNPAYNYTDTGSYHIRLIAYSPSSPSCNDTVDAIAYVFPKYTTRFDFLNGPCSAKFDFLDSSFGNSKGNWNYRLWNFGDGFYSVTKNPTHKYNTPGSYTITLIAAADSGCADTLRKSVLVAPVPVSAFSVSVDTCGHTARFTNASATASSYHWDFGDGTVDSSYSPTHIYFSNGLFTASLVAKSLTGCTDTFKVPINVAAVPIANFDFTSAPCDSFITFHNLSINSTSTKWDFGDLSYTFNGNPVHLYHGNGVFTVTLHAQSTNNTCQDMITKQVEIIRTPIAGFKLSLDTCNLKISTSNLTKYGKQYKWIFSDGTVLNSTDAVHQFTAGGNTTVQLVANSDSACLDTATILVTIPPLPKADFTSIRPPCDSVVQFTQASTNANQYQWQFGDVCNNVVNCLNSSTDIEPSHTYHVSGDVNIKLVSTSPYGCADSIQKSMYLLIRTPADFSHVIDSCTGQVYLSNQSPLALTYDWNFGDSTTGSGQNAIHSYPVNDNYIVTYFVNKGTVCEELVQKDIHYEVNTGEYIYVPNAFTPNNDGRNDLFQIKSWMPCVVYSFTIVNRWGEVVYQTSDAVGQPWDGTCNGKPVEGGVYAYVLKGGQSKMAGRIVVVR